ncbi:MAG: short chain dehydrogenase [Marinifilaceae bacterium]|jgi:NAD(P)-dependent dehydrogenase (short-subunit alcohol dehydrogenase family)|nr:short chain dehydrogenase [Marinifilaceae bacterium]
MKKLVLVGSTGVIGSKVVELMKADYEIVTVNRTSGDYQLDMSDANAVEEMFKKIGSFDALISTSGYGKWGSIDEHSIQDYHDGLNSKLMGQVNLVVIGRKYANEGASFAVSTGILAQYPVEGGISLGMINAGLEAFVRGASLEMKNMTINSVSPSFAKETMELMGMDSSTGVPAIEFAKLYKNAVEEGKSGDIYYAS